MTRRKPLYQAIKAHILERIDSGEWRPGDRITAELKIAAELGASRMTVNRAIRELTADGLLIRKQGMGTIVAKPRPQTTVLEIRDIAREIAQRGGNYSCTVHTQEGKPASPYIAGMLGLEDGAEVYHVVLVHAEDDRPIQLEDRYVNPRLAPEFINQEFSTMTPSQYLLRELPLTDIEHLIEAKQPNALECELLDIPSTEPCLVLCRRSWAGEPVVTRVRLVHPGSAYSIGGRITTNGTAHA